MTTSASSRVRTSVIAVWRRLLQTADLRQPSWVRPLPRVVIHTGRWLPAWILHVGAAAVAVGCVALVATSRPQWTLALILIALMLVRPSGVPPALFALWVGLQVATAEQVTYSMRSLGLIAGIHFLAVLQTTAADVTPGTRIEIRVLHDPLRRLAVIQAVVQPVAWLTMAVAAQDFSLPWLPIVAAVGLAAISWFLAEQFTRTSEP